MRVNFQTSVYVLSTKGCPKKVCKPCNNWNPTLDLSIKTALLQSLEFQRYSLIFWTEVLKFCAVMFHSVAKRIFLSLRFYVKASFTDFRRSKISILQKSYIKMSLKTCQNGTFWLYGKMKIHFVLLKTNYLGSNPKRIFYAKLLRMNSKLAYKLCDIFLQVEWDVEALLYETISRTIL